MADALEKEKAISRDNFLGISHILGISSKLGLCRLKLTHGTKSLDGAYTRDVDERLTQGISETRQAY